MFDPYRKWLGIPKWEQPPNHYRLLGINLFENDLDVIETAADRQMGHIRNYQAGKHSKLSQGLLNELSAARVCLLNAEKKKTYDEKLRADLAVRRGDAVVAGPPFSFFVRGAARYFGVVARQFWLSRIVLPGAYVKLGHDIVCHDRYRARMPELYARLEEVGQRLAVLHAAKTPAGTDTAEAPANDPGEPPAGTVTAGPPANPGEPLAGTETAETPAKDPGEPPAETETAGRPDKAPGETPTAASEPAERGSRVKRAAQWLTITTKSAYLSQREAAVLREIGRMAWRIDHEQAGPIDLTTRVREALTGIEECRAEVKTLSEIPPDQWLSPKRLAWIVLGILGLLATLYFLIRWML